MNENGTFDKMGLFRDFKAYVDERKFEDLYNYSKSLSITCFASVFSKEDVNIHLKITNEFIKIPYIVQRLSAIQIIRTVGIEIPSCSF